MGETVRIFRVAMSDEGVITILPDDTPYGPDPKGPPIVARYAHDANRLVSTAFLPPCMGSEDGRPMCFATVVVFGIAKKAVVSQNSELNEALRAHDEAVAQLKAGVWG